MSTTVPPTHSKIIVKPIKSIGIAVLEDNYVTFLDSDDTGRVITGHYGSNFDSALEGMRNELLNQHLKKKASKKGMNLDELEKLLNKVEKIITEIKYDN